MGDSHIELGTFVPILIAVGIIEAYINGVPWFLGGAVGVILGVLEFLGLIPIIGQIIYWFIGHWIFSVIGIPFLSWTFWIGFIGTILVSIIVVLFILVYKEM